MRADAPRPTPAPTAPTSGEADRAAAHEAYEQGKAAFAARDFLRAGQLFLDAYARAPHHDPLWNAARAFDLGGEAARAANLYTRYLEVAPPDGLDRDRATAARKELATRLGRLDVVARGVDAVKVDGVAIEGTTTYVAPGDHVVTGRARDGASRDVRAQIKVAAGASASVVLEPPPPAAPPPPPPSSSSTAATMPVRAEPRGPRVLPSSVVWIGAGLTAALGVVTVVSGLDTLDAKHRYDTAPTGSLLDSGRAKETRTNVLFWSTIGVGTLTGIAARFFVDWLSSGTAVRAQLGPMSARIEGTFP